MNEISDPDTFRGINPDSEWLKPQFELHAPAIEQMEIQIVSLCNRSCSFCPSGTFDAGKEMISLETVEKLANHLVPLGFSGTIGLHLMCEPLLHKKFAEIVSLFRRKLPECTIRIESNGDALDKDFSRLNDYFDAGLNEILINCYDSAEQRERRNAALKSMGDGIWYWNAHMRFPKGPKSGWRVVRLRDFYEEGYSLRNWAGHVEQQRPGELSFPLPLSCARPFRRVHVNWRGQAVLCNNDWKHEVVIGDLTAQGLDEVWNAPLMLDYRRKLLDRRRDMPLCETCDAGLPWEKSPQCLPAGAMAAMRHRGAEAGQALRKAAGKMWSLGR